MLRLVLADLACLANLFRRREGRRLLVSAGISLAFLGFVSDLFGQVVAQSPQLGTFGGGEDGLRGLLSSLLVPGLLLCLWFGFGGGPRQLFELGHVDLLMQVPRRASTVLLGTWLRFGAIVAGWCTVLCAPTAIRVGDALGLDFGWGPAAAACTALALPATAVILTVQVVLMRFFAGRITRVLLVVLGAAGSLVFSLLLIAGALAQEETVRAVLGAARGQAVWPFLIEAPGLLWTELETGAPRPGTIARAVAMVVAAAALVAGSGLLYRRAYENARGSVEPLLRWGRGRRWPASAIGVVFRKEFAQLLHQPAQLVGLMFSAVVVVVLAGGRFLDGAFASSPPGTRTEEHVFLMLALWLFAQLTVAPGCLLRMVVIEGAQWTVIAAAPARSTSVLLGKLGAVAVLMTWPALVAGVVGVVRHDVNAGSIGAFALVVPACIVWTACATALIGTIPPLMRPRPERNNLLALVGVVILMLVLQATAIPGIVAWTFVVQARLGHGPLAGLSRDGLHAVLIGGAWLLALLAGGTALAFAALQVRRLRAPER